MKKLRLPQPYAQMVVCGALRSIPNTFENIENNEKIFIFAKDIDESFTNGINPNIELHRRVHNEMVLGNIPDNDFYTNCFIGYVIVSTEEEADDIWQTQFKINLKITKAKLFQTPLSNHSTPYHDLWMSKTIRNELRRMVRDDFRLIVPVGKKAWENLKYRETVDQVFLFWEDYMSEIKPFILSKAFFEFNDFDDITDVIFEYEGQTKRFLADNTGSNIRTLIYTDKFSGEEKLGNFFTFDLSLESLCNGGYIEEIPSKPKEVGDEKQYTNRNCQQITETKPRINQPADYSRSTVVDKTTSNNGITAQGKAQRKVIFTSDIYPDDVREALNGDDNLFITGKAGTGKTTLLKEIVRELKINGNCVAVAAPTGVAANNARGVTLHSLLKLPTAPYLPNAKMDGLFSLNGEEIIVIKNIDTLIIDEVSMVRCDLLDMVDEVLRHYRKSTKVFGGVRVIVFGDLYQLMPVAKSEDWTHLKEWYRSLYFFSSRVYVKNPFKMITLEKVYRQTDSDFLDLLNEVREGKVSEHTLTLLQNKYQEDEYKIPKKGVIRITTHNRLANNYNEDIFKSLRSEGHDYNAFITGFVRIDEYPTSHTLTLKQGARVMFVKNDTSLKRAYVNGTLGTVQKCGAGYVDVRIDDSGKILRVNPQTWYFDEYHYIRSSHTIELRHRGTFQQIPLKLAWAITIHKSQGLTFDNVVIDAGKAFTNAQVYVALSRCRKFEGITLATPITAKEIMTDPIVKHFMDPNKDNDELPTYSPKKKSSRKPKKPSGVHGLDLLKWMAEHDFSIDEMSAENDYNYNRGLVYHDLCKLIRAGKLGIACRLTTSKINDVKRAIDVLGLNAQSKDLKPLCKTNVSCAEIDMVKSHLEYMNRKKK